MDTKEAKVVLLEVLLIALVTNPCGCSAVNLILIIAAAKGFEVKIIKEDKAETEPGWFRGVSPWVFNYFFLLLQMVKLPSILSI